VLDVVRRDSTGARFAVLGATNYTACAVSALGYNSGGSSTEYQGMLARYVDSSNYLALRWTGGGLLALDLVIAGVSNVLASVSLSGTYVYSRPLLAVSAAGDVVAYFSNYQTGVLMHTLVASHTALGTGGTHATGKPGIIDLGSIASGGPHLHMYDNVQVWVPPTDAGVFGGQSAQIRSDGVFREDSAGTTWQKPSSYVGDYLRVPPAGAEARTSRVIVRPIYHPGSGGVWLDDRIDDMSARIFATPRYL